VPWQRPHDGNGHRTKTVLTDVGSVEINAPRDRDVSFEPKIVAKRQKRLSGKIGNAERCAGIPP
jgi:transposase-like protein